MPAGREGGVESICSSDAEPIDTFTDYGILYLFPKDDRNSIGNFETEASGWEVTKCKIGGKDGISSWDMNHRASSVFHPWEYVCNGEKKEARNIAIFLINNDENT